MAHFGIEAVESQDHKTLDSTAGKGLAVADRADDVAEGPGQQGQNAGYHGHEYDQETAHYRETGTGTDVGLGRLGEQEQAKPGKNAYASGPVGMDPMMSGTTGTIRCGGLKFAKVMHISHVSTISSDWQVRLSRRFGLCERAI